jgi:hypothetical protein
MIRLGRYQVQRARGASMKHRALLFAITILGTVLHAAADQPKKKATQVDAPSLDSVLANTSTQPNPVLADLMAPKPEMPLGPQDVLKAYEIAMSLLSDKTSADFSQIVQAQQANQITRGRAEYLLQQRYQVAMIQYQVLSALHDVLQHDIEEATQKAKDSVNTAKSNTVLVVPLSDIASAGK